MGYLVAIDQGTTGNTVIVLDEALNVHAKVNREFPQVYPKPGWVEHDPEAISKTIDAFHAGSEEHTRRHHLPD